MADVMGKGNMYDFTNKLEMWANVMATLPNVRGALCSKPQFG